MVYSSAIYVTLILNHQHKYDSGFVGQLLGRGGARTAAASKMESFVIIVNDLLLQHPKWSALR